MARPTLRDLLKSGVHFGHKTRYWNPQMKPYIYGARNNIHIINLDKTMPLLNDALDFVANMANRKSRILFVGTKMAAQDIIREEAERCGMPYVNHRWLGGMLTNYKTVRQSIKRLRDLERMQNDGVFDRMIKKEALNLRRELAKLKQTLGGIQNMGGLPDVIFMIDVGNEKIALCEAKKLGIPVIGVVDTNNSPDDIDYMIPGNDDAQRAIRVYCKAVADMIIENQPAKDATAMADEYVEIDSKKNGPATTEASDNQGEAASPVNSEESITQATDSSSE